MGMEQSVDFAPGAAPAWPAIRAFLSERGFPVQLRMIDGQLAFPDEEPPAEWKELRIGTPQGMITMRHDGERLTFVTWGNAERPLLEAWNALVWACAHLGAGRIHSDTGSRSASEYQRVSDLPAVLKE